MEESNNTKPLISIITVVLNDKDNIEKTILSVLNQNYKNIQYIIIDGGSSDGTIDIIKKYEKNIGFWVSEKDKGIYDAFNKGLKHTNGDLIGFTNSGDTLTNESLDYLVDYYNNYKEADFFFGAVKTAAAAAAPTGTPEGGTSSSAIYVNFIRISVRCRLIFVSMSKRCCFGTVHMFLLTAVPV